MKNVSKLRPVALATTLAIAGLAASVPAQAAEVTGNISVVSKYVLRGVTTGTENKGAAVQGGLDLATDSGFYAGYWGSSLSYTEKTSTTNGTSADAGFENDIYAGYKGSVGAFGYDIGAVTYQYMSVQNSDGTEASLGASYGPLSLGVKYLMDNVAWGNKGDQYWTLGYSTDLPQKFSLSATAGYYIYDKSDSSNPYMTNGSTKISSAFRNLDLTLSHPLGNSGADMNITYVVAGKTRDDSTMKNTMVLGVSYGF